ISFAKLLNLCSTGLYRNFTQTVFMRWLLVFFRFVSIATKIGLRQAFFDVYNRVLRKFGLNVTNRIFYLTSKNAYYPLFARLDTSDEAVFQQVFHCDQYSCLGDISNPKFIIDGGANVGYSSVYFLNKFCDVSIVAVEPDDMSIDICRQNLKFYGNRAKIVHAGLWSSKTRLIVNKSGQGKEWSTFVKECKTDEKADVYAIDIYSLLKESGFAHIDILKLDVEGSEAVIFANHYKDWLNRTKNIVIELHGDKCEETFFNAMFDYDYELSRSGELTICKNIKPKILM
ncbi:MAG: FkbM family methyltransferase, partial [Candidatus Omnitrophica bacterium]|nr:FkbM family methyltransferase [Candidatus Omnitrophota bacterium]